MRPIHLNILLFLLLTGSGYSFERTFTFEEDDLNVTPKGIIIDATPDSTPLVIVRKDEDAKKPNKLLTLCGSRFPGTNFFGGTIWFSNILNGKLSIRFKHTGDKDQKVRTIGLVWRKGDKGSYSVECDTGKSVLMFCRNQDKERDVLEKEKVSVPAGEWITLSVEFNDDQMVASINGKEVLKGSDGHFKEAGRVGFMVQSDTVILADDFKIQGE